MAIHVKVVPSSERIAPDTAATVIGDDVVRLQQSSNVALDIDPDQVAGYAKEGPDLIVQLTSGEQIRLANFYADGQPPSHLFLTDDRKLVAVDLPVIASDGPLVASYLPQETLAGFESLTAAGAAGASGAAGGVSSGMILGGLAAVGAAAALASSGGGGDGNRSTPPPTPRDTTPPPAPGNLAISGDGRTLSGTGEAGATVRVDTNGDGQADVTTTVGADGRFSVTLSPPLTNGQSVRVSLVDAAGNVGPAGQVAAPDTTPPAAASGVVVADDGSSVSGSGEPGATVGVDIDGDGIPDVSGVIGADGQFLIPFDPPLTNGETVSVVVRDAAGNNSAPSTVMAPDFPDAPQVDASNGSVVSGTAAAGLAIVIRDGGGSTIGQTTADADGNWSFTPASPLPDGAAIEVVAQDGAGNSSPPTAIIIDAVAPPEPSLNPSNGALISGTAEAGSTVRLSDGNGNPIGQVVVDADGSWRFTPATPLPDGAVVDAVAADPAGNTSGAATVTVDAVAPVPPTLVPSNGSSLAGTAEPGSTVVLTDGNGTPIGRVEVDGSGHWSFTPVPALADGTVVSAVAQDATGNTSPPATVTVDASAPAAPEVAPSSGTVISGSAEAGASVTLVDGNGNPIGQTSADGDGQWSFTPASPLPNGTVVTVTATDASGNTSPPGGMVVDALAPAAPVLAPSNGSTISGSAEPGSTVRLVDGNGAPIGQTVADAAGNWTFSPASPLPDGTVIKATATDPAGNTGAEASTTVDALAPATPTVALSNGTSLSGTAEPGSTVILTDGNGAPIAVVGVDGSGQWVHVPATPLANGTVVNVVAQDAAGNNSPPASVTVDASAPPPPQIQPGNGMIVSGTAEGGARITLTDGLGNPVGQTSANADGDWSFSPASPLPHGSVIVATATDATGNTSAPTASTVDAQAPPAPVLAASNGALVSGTAEAGAWVLLTDGNGNPIGQTQADGNGDWSLLPGSPLDDGTVINAVARDAAGNSGPQGTTQVDAQAPPAPTVNPTNGNVINGLAEPDSRIVLVDASGNPIGETTTSGSGHWSFTPPSPLPHGTVVNAVAIDAAGNASGPGSTLVDTSLPTIPQVDPSNGGTISGSADPGNTLILTDGNGNPIGQVMADGAGNWSFSPGVPLPDGTVVQVVARNPAGTDSAPAVISVDGVAPPAPQIDPSNGVEITGTAEAGATILLADGDGTPLGQTAADGNGNWSFTPGTPLPNGTVVEAVARDAAGNTSGPANVTVDAVAPPAPVINPSNGVVVSGTAESGAQVILSDGNGNPIGQATADGAGSWVFAPASPLPNGTVVMAVAQDAAGNASGPASTTVDAVAPPPPVINASNGVVISGTAEIGAKVILTDGNGNPIGQVTADGAGNWSLIPATPLANGVQVNAVAQDAAGNSSGPVTTVVDAVVPLPPVIAPSNGSVLAGTAEAGAKVVLSDGNGNPIGQATADGAGNWSFMPGTPLPNGTVVNAVAQDAAGNSSGPASTTVDALPPPTPVINASNGSVLAGTAEIGAKVILTDGNGNPIGQVTADGSGNWSFVPATPLPNGTVVNVIAQDVAGNSSGLASTTVDNMAPPAPTLLVSADGTLLTIIAEPNSQVRVVLNGDTANPVRVNVDGAGNASLPLAPPLVGGEPITAVTVDAAGNVSGPATISAPDLAPPTISVAEAADSWINGAEISDGIQVNVTVRPTQQVGQVVTVKFAGQNGYEAEASHVLSAADIAAGNVTVTLTPPAGQGPFPQGASTITADINGGADAMPVSFTVDTIPPGTPVLSLLANLLTISAEPGTTLVVTLMVGGVVATATVSADNSGLASLNLLADLDIDFSWSQLLNAQVSVVGYDPAGNPSNVASIGIGANIEQPVTIGNFGVDVSLNLFNPRFGFSGTTEADSSVVIRVITPVLNVQLLPIHADATGHFALNLLDPAILTQLGLNITDILNLGAQISFNLVATDADGNDNGSASYGITLVPSGLSLNIGQIDVLGTAGNDVMSGANGSAEHINGGDGSDLVFNVGTGDQVLAGNGDDTVQITATNFVSIAGGGGFDTLLLANGIDLDYNASGVGTLSSIERLDLGRGDAGSVVTLTAAEVLAITDANDTLQITGESNDVLNVLGAVNTGTTQSINGITYDVYTFGAGILLVEDNTVQVVT